MVKHPAEVMVFSDVASNRKKMPPFFYKVRDKMSNDALYKVLSYYVLLCLNYPQGN